MLQGSLDNFALDEVLGLLSSTTKTGRLSVNGDRGDGSLLLNDGRLVDAQATATGNGSDLEDVLFELLRYRAGSFEFDACQVDEGGHASDVSNVLAAAEGRLADWRAIEAVVPSLDHRISLAPMLPADEVSINRSEWLTLRTIAGGCAVSFLCDELGAGEVEGSRQVKGLVDSGLIVVGPPENGRSGGGADSMEPVAGSAKSGVDALTGPATRDPFARRAVETGAVGGGPRSSSMTAPTGLATIEPPEVEAPPAPTSSVESLMSGKDERRSAGEAERPPPPAVPTARDLEGLTGGALEDDTENISVDTDDDEPGGLLMRYLKSDG